jgi:hypothetical protein
MARWIWQSAGESSGFLYAGLWPAGNGKGRLYLHFLQAVTGPFGSAGIQKGKTGA